MDGLKPRSILMFKDKKVLVTGGTGFLGKAVVKNLSASGYQYVIPTGRGNDLTAPKEADRLLKGVEPDETNAPYGIAKKSLMQLIMSYKEQYDFNGVNLIPVNMYGPHDNFDPSISHVIPALILRFHGAMRGVNHEAVEIWGTGEASREFLYIDDCAEAIKLSLEKDVSPEPINIGTGGEIKIKYLAHTIAEIMGYQGSIYFNSDYPDGQPRRCLDISRAKERLGYEPTVDLYDGLEVTIDWFKANSEKFDVYLDSI